MTWYCTDRTCGSLYLCRIALRYQAFESLETSKMKCEQPCIDVSFDRLGFVVHFDQSIVGCIPSVFVQRVEQIDGGMFIQVFDRCLNVLLFH